jgi:hypothetical protein
LPLKKTRTLGRADLSGTPVRAEKVRRFAAPGCAGSTEEMKAIGEAYDAAWLEIANNYSNVAVEQKARG